MLIDDVRGSDLIRSALGEKAHDKLRLDLESAQRFVLAEDFAEAATQISKTNMAAFSRCVSACRPPFPTSWIEVAQAHRRSFSADNSNVPMSEAVSRVGILVTQQSNDGMSYIVELFFRSASRVGMSTVSTLIDLREHGNEAKSARHLTHEELMELRKRLSAGFSGENLEAALEIECMTAPVFHVRTRELIDRITTTLGVSGAREITAVDQSNWDGEVMFWLSAIALLNTRNVGSRDGVDVSKLNQKRVARGELPLLSYETCRIDRARDRNPNANGGDIRYAGKRAHFVRGHFKLRKTGVFWWRPAVRGDASLGIKLKAYDVRHGPVAHRAA